ncbi:MAG: large subunit ribosomal protein L9 [Candidatus Saganbacteria bacterium]|uniref:Large ribosomal subunit protein bL9 n=1 Tax=Candidatus Saganbacteria bacterium TaxID=2575572 RepID=A0A833NWC8_UNCSA|nr:MAG: large subunit ribosomal protein L9 [Candidatus Saganbacteria bacterium]
MKVILLEEDRIAEVADGFARNYLFPKKLAISATPAAIKQMEKKAEVSRHKREEEKKVAQDVAGKLTEVVIKADAGEEGKLFGSITTSDVSSAISSSFGLDVDKRKINLNEQIKAIGVYTASIKLHRDVVAHLNVRIEKK